MSDIRIILRHDVYRDKTVEPINLRNAIYAGDASAQRIMFRVWENHDSIVPDDLSQETVSARFVRPDGGDVVIAGVGGPEWSYVDLPEDCYVYPGVFRLLIRVSSASLDVVTSVMYVVGRVEKPTTENIIDPGSVLWTPEQLTAAIAACSEATAAANTAATTANTAAAVITGYTGAEKAGVYGTYNYAAEGEAGYYNTSGATASAISSDSGVMRLKLPVSQGDRIKIALGVTWSTNIRLWAVVNSDMGVLRKCTLSINDYRTSTMDVEITEAAAAYLLICWHPNTYPGGYVARAVGGFFDTADLAADTAADTSYPAEYPLDRSSSDHKSALISGTTGLWSTSDGYYCWIASLSGIKAVTVAAYSTRACRFAFLRSNSFSNGAAPAYASGDLHHVVAAGETVTMAVPAGAAYLYIADKTGSTNFYPQHVYLRRAMRVEDTIAEGMHGSADRAIAKNELILIDGALYRAKTAIASGTAFAVGTNVERALISGELLTLSDLAGEMSDTQRLTYTDAGAGFVNGNTGAIADSHNTLHKTDYIDVAGLASVTFPQYFSGSTAGYAFYKSDKSFISGGLLDGSSGSVITAAVPSGAAWFACSFTAADSASVYFDGTKTVFSRLAAVEKNAFPEDDPTWTPEAGNFINIFSHIGVIGDSLSSGVFNAPKNGSVSATTVTDYTRSWIQQIAKRNGITAYNFSAGGYSSKTWLNSEYATMISDGNHDCEAYFIALCHNDYNDSIAVGTSADIGTQADSFYRYYSDIIALIQTYAPYSKVFLITAKDNSKFGDYNTAIKYMPTVFTKNVYVLDMATWGGGKDVPDWMKTGAHGNAMGYLLYSRWIEAATGWYIKNNPGEFAYVQLIGSTAEANIPDSQNAGAE